jgi:hypothetical protein
MPSISNSKMTLPVKDPSKKLFSKGLLSHMSMSLNDPLHVHSMHAISKGCNWQMPPKQWWDAFLSLGTDLAMKWDRTPGSQHTSCTPVEMIIKHSTKIILMV